MFASPLCCDVVLRSEFAIELHIQFWPWIETTLAKSHTHVTRFLIDIDSLINVDGCENLTLPFVLLCVCVYKLVYTNRSNVACMNGSNNRALEFR